MMWDVSVKILIHVGYAAVDSGESAMSDLSAICVIHVDQKPQKYRTYVHGVHNFQLNVIAVIQWKDEIPCVIPSTATNTELKYSITKNKDNIEEKKTSDWFTNIIPFWRI